MYTLIMKSNKQLVASQTAKLYQRENAVDKIQFLLPPTYEDLDVSEALISLKYVDQQQVAHSEVLNVDEELYKDEYVRCTLPVTSELTRFAGDITMWLSVVKVDMDTMTQYVLHTGEHVITIAPLSDLYAMVADDTLDAIDQRMAELSAKLQATDLLAEEFARNQVDDLKVNDEGLLQVSAKGEVKGEGVLIQVPELDEDSSPDDAVLDLSELRVVTL